MPTPSQAHDHATDRRERDQRSEQRERDERRARRERMVERQIEARGVTDRRILDAMRKVPRERFVPPYLQEFAYDDTPLPIEPDRTIAQPFIVATMIDALQLGERAGRVLDVGVGPGYGAAVLADVVDELYGLERDPGLANQARERLRELGCEHAVVGHGDGTLGWPEHAPYDGILVGADGLGAGVGADGLGVGVGVGADGLGAGVGADGPQVPQALIEQLAIGGRLVIPVATTPRTQRLRRITRISETEHTDEDLGAISFVPLVGAGGGSEVTPLPEVLARHAEPFDDVEAAAIERFVERVGDARVVCLGEATHGTAEFYRMRARLSHALIERKGFDAIAIEGDWPDTAQLDRYVRDLDPGAQPLHAQRSDAGGSAASPAAPLAFTRFPTWMWRNREFQTFVDELREHNRGVADRRARVGLYGLDLYSLYRSIERVLEYLDEVDPAAAKVARERYGCLTPWQQDPSAYGLAALTGRYRACEGEVISMLGDLLHHQLQYSSQSGDEGFFDAARNARLVATAEHYYRAMYYGSVDSWNLRDRHMFDTLEALLELRGARSKIIVWAHNSHLGDASATEMGARGEHDLGQLCRERLGDGVYLVGFGTDHGTVAAASQWGGPVEIMPLRPAHERSYEHACHQTGLPGFFLPIRTGAEELRRALLPPRLQRAVGVVYRPQTELASHYFEASLGRQFDELVWIDRTQAVQPLPL